MQRERRRFGKEAVFHKQRVKTTDANTRSASQSVHTLYMYMYNVCIYTMHVHVQCIYRGFHVYSLYNVQYIICGCIQTVYSICVCTDDQKTPQQRARAEVLMQDHLAIIDERDRLERRKMSIISHK